MKKNVLFILFFVAKIIFAQSIFRDSTFGSNGIFNVGSYNYNWEMAQDSENRIYSSYSVYNGSETFLFRLTINGNLDPTFGNNGKIKLPYYTYNCKLEIQPDGKLIIFGFTSGVPGYNYSVGVVYRILQNGQLDTTFGTGGTSVIVGVGNGDLVMRSFGLILQNEKIIVYGMGAGITIEHAICRLNADGSFDNTFGENGFVSTQGNFNYGTFVLTDNQNNIVCITKVNPVGGGNGIIEKFNPDGQHITSFGNNGILQLPYSLGYVGAAMIDSNNKIVYSDENYNILRMNPDGTPDNTFNYNLLQYSGYNEGGAWIQSIVEKDGYYYIGGNGEGDFTVSYFISRLNQNGSVDPSFGYYSDLDDTYSIKEMIIHDNNIIVNGDSGIVKYILNNTSLSTTEPVKKTTEITFENPVHDNFIFKTKEKIRKIEVYSAHGKLLKIIKENNENISELPNGIYITKILFENGEVSSKKLIKN